MEHEQVWHVILALEENYVMIIFIITYNDQTHLTVTSFINPILAHNTNKCTPTVL